MVNYAALDAAIQYGLDHPKEFDMGSWMVTYTGHAAEVHGCGTTACLAGTVAYQAGWKASKPPLERQRHWEQDYYDPSNEIISWHFVQKPGESLGPVDISEAAAEILDLTRSQADHLFYLKNIYQVINVRNTYAQYDEVPENTFGLADSVLDQAWEEED